MELLESVGPRPRQARYQAALRPDKYDGLFYRKLRNCPQAWRDRWSV